MVDTFDRFYVDLRSRDGRAALVDRLADHGLVTFDRIGGRNEALALMRSIATVVHHRDSDPDGVTALTATEPAAGVRSGFAGFSSGELTPHTDRSSLPRPPTLVMLICAVPATEGGATVVIDGRELYDSLATEAPQVLQELVTPRSALFGTAAGHLGSVFEPVGGGAVSIRFRLDDLARFSPAVTAVLPRLLELMQARTVRFALGPGQGYILQNGRWLHGRTGFSGRRRMYRILGEPHPADRLGRLVSFGFMPTKLPRSSPTSGPEASSREPGQRQHPHTGAAVALVEQDGPLPGPVGIMRSPV
jgi:alpha-ketoglutarate-dependent taurine dioxygenase